MLSEKVAAYMAKNKDIRAAILNKKRESGFVNNVADNVAEVIIGKRKRSQSINKQSPNIRPNKTPKEPEIPFLSIKGVNKFFDDYEDTTSKNKLYEKVKSKFFDSPEYRRQYNKNAPKSDKYPRTKAGFDNFKSYLKLWVNDWLK